MGLRADRTGHFQCDDFDVDGLGVGSVCELKSGYEDTQHWANPSLTNSLIRAFASLIEVNASSIDLTTAS